MNEGESLIGLDDLAFCLSDDKLILLSLSHELLLLGIEALLSAQVLLQKRRPFACALFLFALILLDQACQAEVLPGLGLKQTGQVAVSVGGAARLHGHGNVVLEACDLLLFVPQLLSEEVILSLEVQNLL